MSPPSLSSLWASRSRPARSQVEEIIGQGGASAAAHIPFTPRAEKVLELSLREALQLGHNYIGTEHILLGLIREGEGVAAQVLVKLGADLSRVRQQVIQLLSGYSPSASATGFGPRTVEGGDELWAAYHESRASHLRDELLARYSPLVEAAADQFAQGWTRNVERSDLVDYGMAGLSDAIERYDPNRGYSLELLVRAVIQARILDELYTRGIHPAPRSVRSKARLLERTMNVLEKQLHRPATDEELATELDTTPAQVEQLFHQISFIGDTLIDDLFWEGIDQGGTPPGQRQAMDSDDLAANRRRLTAETIARLPEAEQNLLRLSYDNRRTMAEIGQTLGVTEDKARIMHCRAVLHLRAILRSQAGGADE